MKKYLWMLVAVCFLSACSKDEEEGPYVPWRPGDQTEETIELDKATKVMILTEQSKNRILMIDQPTGKIAWEWKAADSGLSVSEQAWFNTPDEAKPVYNRTCVLVTASGGGVALIRIADKKVLFYAKPGGNPHSAEVLPDKNIVVASSTGNLLSVYVYNEDASYVSKPAFTMPVYSAHNVVWDRTRNCLWTATGAQLLKLSYNGNRTAPELSQVYSYDMGTGNTMAHDLAQVAARRRCTSLRSSTSISLIARRRSSLTYRFSSRRTSRAFRRGPKVIPRSSCAPRRAGATGGRPRFATLAATVCSTVRATRFIKPAGMWRTRLGIPKCILCNA